LLLFDVTTPADPVSLYYLRSYALTLAAAVIGSTPLPRKLTGYLTKRRMNWIPSLASAAVLVIATAYLVDGSYNPFLYFRF
ncbi:MAG: MBOAT family protein, partial [Clostridia bacterium]|nr:MBOAT family protein [Clostridia bacterium]